MAAAAKNERPNTTPPDVRLRKPSHGASNSSVPNSARRIEGVPASISIVDSTTRASAAGRPNSLSQTAIAIPTGTAIAIDMIAITTVSSSGSKNPPVWLSL